MKTNFFISLILFISASAFAQEPQPRDPFIEVTGRAEIEVEPNEIYLLVRLKEFEENRQKTSLEQLDKDFLNAMKAAICLFDIELQQMRPEIRAAYRDNKEILGIFPVAAYNGGPRNVTKLYKVMQRLKVNLADLRRPGEQPAKPVPCPCVWKEDVFGVRPISVPRYNNENRWYIEKYQSILSAFEEPEPG